MNQVLRFSSATRLALTPAVQILEHEGKNFGSRLNLLISHWQGEISGHHGFVWISPSYSTIPHYLAGIAGTGCRSSLPLRSGTQWTQRRGMRHKEGCLNHFRKARIFLPIISLPISLTQTRHFGLSHPTLPVTPISFHAILISPRTILKENRKYRAA